MPVIDGKSSVKIKSIAEKLESLRHIASVALNEVETIASRSYPDSENIDYYVEIERFEIELILYALYRAKGNQRRAARILNIKPTTLNSKVKKFNLVFDDAPDGNGKSIEKLV